MTAGAPWTSGVNQYYNTSAYSLSNLSPSHIVNGGSVSVIDIDSASTTTVSNISSISMNGSTLNVSNASGNSIAFTSSALSTNGTSRNYNYIRSLSISFGYW